MSSIYVPTVVQLLRLPYPFTLVESETGMSLTLDTPSCPTNDSITHVQLSRGSELYVQQRRFTDSEHGAFTLDCLLIDDCRGEVVKFCNHWLEDFVNKVGDDYNIAKQLRDQRNCGGLAGHLSLKQLGGIGSLGVISIRSLERHFHAVLEFHPRIDGEIKFVGQYMGFGNLGFIKTTDQLNPSQLPRRRKK